MSGTSSAQATTGFSDQTARCVVRHPRAGIKMAHARGVRIYGGTLTPFAVSNAGYGGNYGGNYGTAKGEALREQVNNWIRTSAAFDGVIDFARASADPYDPLYLNPVYNSGDSLHPGDLGYEAMAGTVPLRFVR